MSNIKLFLVKKSFFLFALLFSITTSVFSQESTLTVDKTGDVHPWSHLDLNNSSENFQFIIVTDRTGGHREGIFESAIDKINLLQPEFVMSVGDLIEGYTRDVEEINRQWDEFNGFIEKLSMPFFYVPGNHDYINDVMAGIWQEKYGRSYYHFRYKDVLFLCLNSEEATKGSSLGGIEKPQYEYFKKVLSENNDVKWTLLFMHQPLWTLDNTRYWPEIEKLLVNRNHTVFVGHYHNYVKYERNNGKYFILGTTGGASKLRGRDFGEFDHVVWVTMTPEGPILANLMLDGIWDENIVTEEIAKMVSASPLKFKPVTPVNEEYNQLNLKLVNDENYPMTANLELDGLGNYSIEQQSIQVNINPNSVEILNLNVNPLKDLSLVKLLPVHIEAEFIYHYEEKRDVKIKESFNYSPSFIEKLKPKDRKVKIDGNLSDWKDLRFSLDSQYMSVHGDMKGFSGKEDLDFYFDAKYDDEYLYVAVKVEDDHIYLNPVQSIWRQDGLRFYLDARPPVKSITGVEQNNGKDFLGIFVSPAKTGNDELIIYQPDVFPEGTLVEAKYEENTLYYEVAVPVTWLNEQSGSEWKNIRLNIGVNDIDEYQSINRIFWRPQWKSAQNVIGSGLFEK